MADQADFDQDGDGDMCDLTIRAPLLGAILDCNPGAAPPTVTWSSGRYDRFRVSQPMKPDPQLSLVVHSACRPALTRLRRSGRRSRQSVGRCRAPVAARI